MLFKKKKSELQLVNQTDHAAGRCRVPRTWDNGIAASDPQAPWPQSESNWKYHSSHLVHRSPRFSLQFIGDFPICVWKNIVTSSLLCYVAKQLHRGWCFVLCFLSSFISIVSFPILNDGFMLSKHFHAININYTYSNYILRFAQIKDFTSESFQMNPKVRAECIQKSILWSYNQPQYSPWHFWVWNLNL